MVEYQYSGESFNNTEDWIEFDGVRLDNLEKNIGIDEYPEFDEGSTYNTGDVVSYNELLYQFIADHAAGAWIGTDVEETDVVKAHIVQELGTSENAVISQKRLTRELKKLTDNIEREITDHADDYFEFQDEEGNSILEITKGYIKAHKKFVDENGNEIGSTEGSSANNDVSMEVREDSENIVKFFLPQGLAFLIKGTYWGFGAVGLKDISNALPRYSIEKAFKLNGGEVRVLPYTMAYADVTYGTTFRFDSDFSGSIIIGRGYKPDGDNSIKHTTNAGWLEITSDKIIEKARQFSWSDYPHTYKEYSHGLNLKSPISIVVQTKIVNGVLECVVKLTNGDGQIYTIDKTGDSADPRGISCSIGTTYLQTSEMNIEVESFSFTNSRYKNDVWLYGDSYMAGYWREYLARNYNINNYFQGFAGGENSESALKSFNTDIKHGVPKHILYGMGMNDDNDTEDNVNLSWLKNTEQFLKICDEYNIIVTMLTVPSVRHNEELIEDHRKLNEWIRSSGRPYIDISTTVEDGNGNWFDGLRSTSPENDIHPSSIGSHILAAKILNEYPVLSE